MCRTESASPTSFADRVLPWLLRITGTQNAATKSVAIGSGHRSFGARTDKAAGVEYHPPQRVDTNSVSSTRKPVARASSDQESRPTERLVKRLADTYLAMVAMAEESGRRQKVTIFHSRHPLNISLHDYLKRLYIYFKCSESCLITSLVYIDRFMKLHSEFRAGERSIHKLLAISLVVSAKFNDDVYYSNAYYSKVCGLNLKELNMLETHFLLGINWCMVVTTDEYEHYQTKLVKGTLHEKETWFEEARECSI